MTEIQQLFYAFIGGVAGIALGLGIVTGLLIHMLRIVRRIESEVVPPKGVRFDPSILDELEKREKNVGF